MRPWTIHATGKSDEFKVISFYENDALSAVSLLFLSPRTYPNTVRILSTLKQVNSGRKEKAAMGKRFLGGRLLVVI